MVRYSLKTLARSPVRTLVWLLALILTGIALCLSAGLYGTSVMNADRLHESYVSTALVDPPPDVPVRTDWGYAQGGFTRLKQQLTAIADASPYATRDNRNLYYGVNEDIRPVSYFMDRDGYSIASFIVDAVAETDSSGRTRTLAQISEVLALHPDYADLHHVIKLKYSKYDLRMIQAGKRYLVTGFIFYVPPGPVDGQFFLSELDILPRPIGIDPDTQAELYSSRMYELTDGLEAFYRTQEGALEKRLIDNVNRMMTCVPVLTTDEARSLPFFNTGESLLLEGRWITREEYDAGAPVCLMSSTLAGKNGCAPGDVLPLGFMDAAVQQNYYYYESGEAWSLDMADGTLPVQAQRDYEIVGIYSGKKKQPDTESITENTIIVPNSAVDMPQSMFFDLAVMAGYLVENGELDAFRREMDAAIPPYGDALEARFARAGYTGSDYFTLLDQGYGDMAAFFTAMRFNSTIVMCVGVGAYLAVIVLYFVLFFSKRRMEAGMLHSVGATRAEIALELFLSIALPILLAGAISAAAARAMYGTAFQLVADISMDSSIEIMRFSDAASQGARDLMEKYAQHPRSVYYAAAVQLAASVIASLAASIAVAARNPLELLQSEVG